MRKRGTPSRTVVYVARGFAPSWSEEGVPSPDRPDGAEPPLRRRASEYLPVAPVREDEEDVPYRSLRAEGLHQNPVPLSVREYVRVQVLGMQEEGDVRVVEVRAHAHPLERLRELPPQPGR